MLTIRQQEAQQTVQNLIQAGCHYDLSTLAELYLPELTIVMLDRNGVVATFKYQQNMAFFQEKRDSQAAPLDTRAEFIFTDANDTDAQVIVTRHMALRGQPEKIHFTLFLKRVQDRWRVAREVAFIAE